MPIPGWVKDAVDAWTDAVDITHGPVFRAINKAGRAWGAGMSPKVLWDMVQAAAGRAGIEKLAPHDLRRTSARLCRLAGGDWIRFDSSWDTSRMQRRSATLDANSDCDARSTTVSESSPTPLELKSQRAGAKRPPLATLSRMRAPVPPYGIQCYHRGNVE